MLEKISMSRHIKDMSQKEARELQSLLTACGFPLQSDGIIGPRTITAFHKFKKSEGLTEPDYIGKTTIEHLLRKSREYHPSRRHINPEGLRLLKELEGCRLKAYKCQGGIPTIGYGSTFYEDDTPVRIGDLISSSDAETLLQNTLRSFEDGVARSVTVPLSGNEFSALVCFAFNVGLGAFRSSSLLRYLNQGNYQSASLEFGKWVIAGGKTSKGLKARREKEKALFLKKD